MKVRVSNIIISVGDSNDLNELMLSIVQHWPSIGLGDEIIEMVAGTFQRPDFEEVERGLSEIRKALCAFREQYENPDQYEQSGKAWAGDFQVGVASGYSDHTNYEDAVFLRLTAFVGRTVTLTRCECGKIKLVINFGKKGSAEQAARVLEGLAAFEGNHRIYIDFTCPGGNTSPSKTLPFLGKEVGEASLECLNEGVWAPHTLEYILKWGGE